MVVCIKSTAITLPSSSSTSIWSPVVNLGKNKSKIPPATLPKESFNATPTPTAIAEKAARIPVVGIPRIASTVAIKII